MTGPSGVFVRAACAGDLERVVQIHLDSFPAGESLISLAGPRFVRAAYRWAIESAESYALVAEESGRVVGFVAVCDRAYLRPLLVSGWKTLMLEVLLRPALLFSPALRRRFVRRPVHAHPELSEPSSAPGSAQLFTVAVDHGARGRGVFRALAKGAEEASRSRGSRRIHAGVYRRNVVSRRAFESSGWVPSPAEETAETLVYVSALDGEARLNAADASMPEKALSFIHVCAHAAAFTQYRRPLILSQRKRSSRLVIYCPEDANAKTLRAEGFAVEAAPISDRPGIRTMFEILRLRRFLVRNRFDVLVAHQPMGALVGALAARLAGVPVLFYSTGGLKHQPGSNGWANRFFRWGELRIVSLCDGVLLVNREDEAALREIPDVAQKAIWVGPAGGCGFDATVWNSATRERWRDDSRRDLGFDASSFVVAFAGRLVWEKGFRDLIEAAPVLGQRGSGRPVIFAIFGRGPEGAEIERAVSVAGLSRRIRFLDYRTDLERALSSADAFVLPSYREGMPVALLQALALGLPCVSTAIRGSRELIRDGVTGFLVSVRDGAALAERISRLADDPDLCARMGLAASREVSEKYSEELLAPRTVEILERTSRAKIAATGLRPPRAD